MMLERSSALVPVIHVLPAAGSTNDELAGLVASGDAVQYTTVVTLNQTGGRGRLGRIWTAPAGKALAASVLVRPQSTGGAPLGIEHFGWLPLIAGVAMSSSIDELVGGRRTRLKWPNDVQIDGQKVCGVLAELTPTADAVIIGTGVNLTLDSDELPVPTATSLALAGVGTRGDELVDAVLSGYLRTLIALVDRFVAADADAAGSGILKLVTDWCVTLGNEVRVQLPGGTDLVGTATGLDETGRLLVRRSVDGAVQAVAAGDVTHLRYE